IRDFHVTGDQTCALPISVQGAQRRDQTPVVGVEEDGRLKDVQETVGVLEHLVAERAQIALMQPRIGIAHGDDQVLWIEQARVDQDRKSTRLNSSHVKISY